MFSSRITASRVPVQSIKRIASTQLTRQLSTTRAKMGKDSKMPSGPPKHQMIYFPGLTSEVRAFGQFRKVMHTGLFSQIVSMEIPVGGDIGNEVHLVDQVLIFTSGEGKATVAGKDQVRNNLVYFSIKC
jgi:mannose-6-phosphate isomerase-like protein (cupin superfamily)